MSFPSAVRPATGLASAARGVTLSDVAIMRWTRPGACRAMSGVTAWCNEFKDPIKVQEMERTSGVESRTPKPVPPVQMTTLTACCATQSLTWSGSSGSTALPWTRKPPSSSSCPTRGPDASLFVSCEAVSLTAGHKVRAESGRGRRSVPVRTAAEKRRGDSFDM